MNPLSMWSSSGIYTNLPYGYDGKFNGKLPDVPENIISSRKSFDIDDYYEDYYYYDEDYIDNYNRIEKIDLGQGDLSQVSILDNILDIILNRKPKKEKKKFSSPRYRPRVRYPPPLVLPQPAEEKSGLDSILGTVRRAMSNIGFFGILLPGILAGLLFMGVPVAQSMFAGASLITTFLLSGESKSLLSPVTLDSMARYVLVNILSFLQDFSNDREGRISDDFPFCLNETLVENKILENGCRGDFLNSELRAGVGVLGNTTMCREGSLPDIVQKIARQVVTIVGACESDPVPAFEL